MLDLNMSTNTSIILVVEPRRMQAWNCFITLDVTATEEDLRTFMILNSTSKLKVGSTTQSCRAYVQWSSIAEYFSAWSDSDDCGYLKRWLVGGVRRSIV